MDIYMSSRRTIMDGEVVTFATGFDKVETVLGTCYLECIGPFSVSASRNGVMVHRAMCKNAEEIMALVEAIRQAESAFVHLNGFHWKGTEIGFDFFDAVYEECRYLESVEKEKVI